ncbi:NrfD/PsrC family molybdoenzyme membrane anchor subunit [Desulforhopalus singaporensis]|uniref:Ni/Fe-hydrogenase 2 integral membrane subunit HybB n=1 Tax=Desulforhopalus singaporensis TaxID=91360 RepID=A0A1H0THG9_9BACT|nr:NrfD/PsrC family molybdoenzyme membrane anchor subunit [Desulforhopalus singaporensis]SDP53130.1 Ni/Fe-hydrogenase 2 integral membrane subunit HybB [Desulforhopalus singaporensis]
MSGAMQHGDTILALTNYVFPNDVYVHWSLMIVLYPYITGIVAGAFIVSSLYHVFGIRELQPISRFSLVFALAFLCCATWPLLLHLGHPERALNMFLTPNPTSAMAGFGYIYSAYLILLVHEILFIYRPTMVGLWMNSTGIPRKLYAFLSFYNDNLSDEAMKLDHKIINFLAGLGIPMACILHGYVGFIFGGIKANPLWATPLMPVIFLLSACVSGISGIIFSYILIRKVTGKPIDVTCIRTSLKFLWGFFILDFVFEMLEVFSHFYMSTHHWHVLESLLWGPLYTTYWLLQVKIFSLIPFFLLGAVCLIKFKDRVVLFVAPIVSLMILIQVLLMRWNVVIGGQLMSNSTRGQVSFVPEWLGREGILAAVVVMAAPVVILFLLGKIFPFWMSEEPKDS